MSKWSKWSHEPHPLIGKTIIKVEKTEDSEYLRFTTDDAKTMLAYAEGDCCSRSWVESFDEPSHMLGTVTGAADLDHVQESVDDAGDSYLQFYGFKITTGRGICVIDYRNKSNGYYGGSLEWDVGHTPSDKTKWEVVAN